MPKAADAPAAGTLDAAAQGEAGFTLVELMVVLALIGLAAGVVVLSLPADGGGAARQAADALAVRIAAARDQAVIGQRAVAVRFDDAGYGFAIRRDDDWIPAPTTMIDGRAWPQGATARTSTARIAFDPVGLPDQPGWVRLTSRTGGDREPGAGAIVRVAANGDVTVGRE